MFSENSSTMDPNESENHGTCMKNLKNVRKTSSPKDTPLDEL